MKFFANQQKDEAGAVGISLQKLIIFFMVLDATFFCLGGNLGSFMSFIYHAVVLMGVYRRRTCVLLIYTIFNVMVFTMTGFVIILVIGALAVASPMDYSSSDSSSGNYVTYSDSIASMVRVFVYPANNTSSDSSSSHSNVPEYSIEVSSGSDSLANSGNFYDEQTMFVAALVVILFGMVILYFKVLSTVLAYRMRKILLSANQGIPTYTPVPTDEAQSDAATQPEGPYSFDPATQQQHPGFFPYHPSMYPGYFPNIQGAPNTMMPPPFMYGQHPVFYTFAPQQQHQQQPTKEEKL